MATRTHPASAGLSVSLLLTSALITSCATAASSSTTNPPPTSSTAPQTYSQDGLTCLEELYEWSMSELRDDYIGADSEEAAVEEFIAGADALMDPQPRDLDYRGVEGREATFLADDGRPVLILTLNDFGNGWIVESFRRCGTAA